MVELCTAWYGGTQIVCSFLSKDPFFLLRNGVWPCETSEEGGGRGEKECLVYTVDVLNCYGIPWCRKFATLMCQLEFCLSEFYITFYAFWMMGMSRRTGCLHWVCEMYLLSSYPPISVSELTPTTAHQTFLFVSNSIKPGKHACIAVIFIAS